MRPLYFFCAVTFCLLHPAIGRGSVLVIPDTTIFGVDVFIGPSFVVSGNFGANDVINARGTGAVDLADGEFTANVAGVILSPGTTNTGDHPGQIAQGPRLLPYASLLIGNDNLGFFPLFPANAAAGLGSAAPPTDITVTNRTLGSIFGSGFTGITSGTTIELRINDINTAGNSGSFFLHSVAAPTPAPSALFTALIGVVPGAMLLRRRK